MALARKISAEKFDKLPADVKSEYKKVGDEYVLDLEGYEDPAELKRAKDREAQARKEAEEKLREAEAKLAETANGDARKRGDIEALEKSWKAQKDEAVKGVQSKLDTVQGKLRDTVLNTTATQIAGAISKSPGIMSRFVKDRLAVEFDDSGEPVVRILDKTGKVSALTPEQLGDEFRKNPEFSSIIAVSKASGGGSAAKGAQGNASGAGGSGAGNDGKKPDLSAMNPKQLAEYITANRENANQPE